VLIGALTGFLPGQHHLFHLSHLGFISLFEFFDSIGISQGIESIFTRTAPRRDVPDHHCLAVSDERVF
jgi:hypothetical protein